MKRIKMCLKKLKIIKVGVLLCLLAPVATTAQVLPDSTLPSNSLITNRNDTSFIEGGTTKGSNLFHSFDQFSVPSRTTAYFNNAVDIQNIFSRVTGGSISNIDGVLRANGTANLFLLNPNGIIFGPNAQLNIGGSFLGSTASSINFADNTQFSATAPQNSSVLTVSVPIGLGFTSNSGEIRVQGLGHSLAIQDPVFLPYLIRNSSDGLQVQQGLTLALLGGHVVLDGGIVTAPGGRIELGSVKQGNVSLSPAPSGWSFGYEGMQSFQNIQLTQQSLADASGATGGSIQIQGAHVTVLDGSVIMVQSQGFQPSGSINVNAFESLELRGITQETRITSSLLNQVVGVEKGGDITVSTKRLSLQDGGQIAARTFGAAPGGNVTVNASEVVQLLRFPLLETRLNSAVSTAASSSGNAGDITITTRRLTGLDGGSVASLTNAAGDAGDLTVNASDSVELIGVNRNVLTPSGVISSTGNDGNSGDVNINTSRLILKNGGTISASTLASGNAGNVTVSASEFVEVNGIVPGSVNPSLIISSAQVVDEVLQQILGLTSSPSTASGNVTIETPLLSVTNGGLVSVRNDGLGNGGTLKVNANLINLDNQGGITATTASGQGGNILLNARNLQLRDNSDLTATAQGGTGSGGNITIDTGTLVAFEDSNITADAFEGPGGNIQINTQGLFVSPDSDITASSDFSVDGTVEINTLDFNARNSLTPLASSFVSTEQVVAGSCLARRNTQQGSFVVTGSGGLPTTPYSGITEWDSLTGVQAETRSNLSEARSQPTSSQLSLQGVQKNYPPSWKPGDPIIEAQGIIVTADGRTLLDMKPQQATTANPETLVCSAASPQS